MKRKSPLRKRIPRNIRADWRKYITLCLLLIITISVTCAIYVGNNSMERAFMDGFEEYNIEDGHFEFNTKAEKKLIRAIEKRGVKVYEQFYKEISEDYNRDGKSDADVRVFINRDEINRVGIIEGELPGSLNEIAIDKGHAANAGIRPGDMVSFDGRDMRVTALVAFSDYSCLFRSNADIMFDAITFNVACVTKETFDSLSGETKYQYAYRYNKRPDEEEKKELADDLIPKIATLAATGGQYDDPDDMEDELDDNPFAIFSFISFVGNDTELTDFVPEYANQAIHFAPNDMGKDKGMCEVLLIVFVVVLGFIFAITASNTIVEESKVIGTLRASGYTRKELLFHYIAVPVVCSFISAIIGNILGYTVLKDGVIAIYGASYTLPKIKMTYDAEAFVLTTVFPLIAVILINVITVYLRLKHGTMQFLSGDPSIRKKKKAIRLPNFRFFTRFRLRVFNQNIPGYSVLFLGIFFVMVLMVFSVGMPYTLNQYISHADEYVLAKYQYVLKDTRDSHGFEIVTNNPDAEKYSISSLSTVSGVRIGEEITIYGYMDNSRYFNLPGDLEKNHVYISSDYGEKFSLKAGDKITLKEKFAKDEYSFVIDGISDLKGSLAIMLPNTEFNRIFDNNEKDYVGYVSDTEITDIEKDSIAQIITKDDILKMANQLNHSMGGMMDIFSYACVFMAILVIYLLTKLIIEKNAGAISMVKVLGYTHREIRRLYVHLTTIIVLISTAITGYISLYFVAWLWKMILYQMTGWFVFEMDSFSFIRCLLMVILAYVAVALIDMRRIKRIPMTAALKDVE